MNQENSKTKKVQKSLTIYERQVVIKTLQTTHCDYEGVNEIQVGKENIPEEKISEFVNLQCDKGQEYVKNLIPITKTFTNCENLLDFLKKDNHDENCNNDIPFVLRWIAESENHPNKNELNGIDLKQLYHTLANMMMGYPIEELDENSKEFLKSMFKETMENLPNLDDDVKLLKENIEKNYNKNERNNTDEVNLEKLLLDKKLNTFQLPINMMLNKN